MHILFVVEKHVKKCTYKWFDSENKERSSNDCTNHTPKFRYILVYTIYYEIGHVIHGDYLKKSKTFR